MLVVNKLADATKQTLIGRDVRGESAVISRLICIVQNANTEISTMRKKV